MLSRTVTDSLTDIYNPWSFHDSSIQTQETDAILIQLILSLY